MKYSKDCNACDEKAYLRSGGQWEVEKAYLERSSGAWEVCVNTEEGRRFYRFYEKSDAFAWATKHHYRLIVVTV